MLHKILLDTIPHHKLYDNNSTVLHERTLDDLKGCVVLLRQDLPQTYGFNVSNWPDDQACSSTDIGMNGKVEMQNAYDEWRDDIPFLMRHLLRRTATMSPEATRRFGPRRPAASSRSRRAWSRTCSRPRTRRMSERWPRCSGARCRAGPSSRTRLSGPRASSTPP